VHASTLNAKENEMTPRDFCYWLQGSFELDKSWNKFTVGETALIRRHLNMVFRAKYNESSVIVTETGKKFCNWLEGALDVADTGNGVDEAAVSKIKAKLDAIFVHVAGTPPQPERPRIQAMC
jgi:hypothetical protein